MCYDSNKKQCLDCMQKILSRSETLKSFFFAVYSDHKEFHHKKKNEEKILRNKKIFSLSIKKPFELKFMPGRLKLYLKSPAMCLHIGICEKREDGKKST